MVSIIIPFYNQDREIGETLDSLLAQNYSNWECLIVDDNLEPRSNKVINNYLEKDLRIKYFKRPENRLKGANSCRNFGYEKSNGNYIQWFDADDLMHPAMLSLKVKSLEDSKANFVVCEGLYFAGEKTNIVGRWDQLESTFPLIDQALGKINFQTNTPMFQRNFLRYKKLWDPGLQRKQDYEFFSRVLTYSTNYVIINEPLFYYRVHLNSINGKNFKSSIVSKIKADFLVFNNVKGCTKDSKLNFIIRRHFLRKTMDRLKLAVSYLNFNAIGLAIISLLQIINFSSLKYYFKEKKL